MVLVVLKIRLVDELLRENFPLNLVLIGLSDVPGEPSVVVKANILPNWFFLNENTSTPLFPKKTPFSSSLLTRSFLEFLRIKKRRESTFIRTFGKDLKIGGLPSCHRVLEVEP